MKETEVLRELNILIIRALEEAGLAKFNKDENGKPVGLHFTIQPHSVVSMTGVSTPKVEKADD